MGSKKRAARAREIAEFKSRLESGPDGLADVFAMEDERVRRGEEQHEAQLRYKSCEKKNRYATRDDAEEALRWCEARGKRGLAIYRCDWCGGWHLTSHPRG